MYILAFLLKIKGGAWHTFCIPPFSLASLPVRTHRIFLILSLCVCVSPWTLELSTLIQPVHMGWHLGLFFHSFVPFITSTAEPTWAASTLVMLPITECLWGRFLSQRVKAGFIPLYILFSKKEKNSTVAVALCMLVSKACASVYQRWNVCLKRNKQTYKCMYTYKDPWKCVNNDK